MKPIIAVQNIGKKYKVAHEKRSYITLRDIIAHPIQSFIKNQHAEDFWALRNVSFDVMKGETLGIIGANGAGKSTLLKILSRITSPSEGEITMRGNVSSLLEVGTGFHPELTGRENIYLNGAILGMTRSQINKKFDEIVDFSGVEQFLDLPVKRYSSGMQVRLAFSVAAHLEPDILVVDEVLAVGDAAFQKKSLGKMGEVTKSEGRTILFVSHNMDAIKTLTTRSLLLRNGQIAGYGPTDDIINQYLQEPSQYRSRAEFKPATDKPIYVRSLEIRNHKNEPATTLDIDKPFSMTVSYEVTRPTQNGYVSVVFADVATTAILMAALDTDADPSLKQKSPGRYTVTFNFPANIFTERTVRILLRSGIWPESKLTTQSLDDVASIILQSGESFITRTMEGHRGSYFGLKIPSKTI